MPDAPEGYHPPHVTHAHAPHLHEPIPPQIVYVHPNVIEANRLGAAEGAKLLWRHPVWATALFLLPVFPGAYFDYRALSEIGWFLIIPPAIVVLFFAPAFSFMAEGLLILIVGSIAKLFGDRGRAVDEWLDTAMGLTQAGAMAGGLAGVLSYFVARLIGVIW